MSSHHTRHGLLRDLSTVHRRRAAVPRAVILVAGLAALVLGAATAVVSRPRPVPGNVRNVLLIIIDTVRCDALGCYDPRSKATPILDALADEGVRFEQAIAQASWTLPSVTSLLTSTWPTIHGAMGKMGTRTHSPERLTGLRPGVVPAQEALAAAGFRTSAVVNCEFLNPALGVTRGFDTLDHQPAAYASVRRADESARAALRILRRHHSESNFMMLHVFDAHVKYDPPPRWAKRFTDTDYGGAFRNPTYEQTRGLMERLVVPDEAGRAYLRGLYEAEVAFVDEQIGRLVQGLRALGVYDRTTIIVVADHGEEFWDHGGFEHGHSLYEEMIRVPLIIKPADGLGVRPGVVRGPVALMDVMPTVLELLGVPRPATFDGRSLAGLLRGGAGPDGVPIYSEGTLWGDERVSWRDGRFKLIRNAATDTDELYDLHNDPGERNNLLETQSADATRLREALEAFQSALRERAASLPEQAPAQLDAAMQERLKSLGYIRD